MATFKFYCLLQLENDNDFLKIYDGGNDQAKLIAHMTGMMNGASISIQGNQMFVVFDTNEEIVKKGFNASIIQGNHIFQYCNHYWLSSRIFDYLLI